jgi:hypothetical protein
MIGAPTYDLGTSPLSVAEAIICLPRLTLLLGCRGTRDDHDRCEHLRRGILVVVGIGAGALTVARLERFPGREPPEDLWHWRARVWKGRTTVRTILVLMHDGWQNSRRVDQENIFRILRNCVLLTRRMFRTWEDRPVLGERKLEYTPNDVYQLSGGMHSYSARSMIPLFVISGNKCPT